MATGQLISTSISPSELLITLKADTNPPRLIGSKNSRLKFLFPQHFCSDMILSIVERISEKTNRPRRLNYPSACLHVLANLVVYDNGSRSKDTSIHHVC